MDTDAFVREQIQAFPGQFKATQGALTRATQSGLAASDELAAFMRANQRSPVDQPLLQFAASMFAPTKTGGFGESLSGGLSSYGTALSQQRADQLDRATKLAQLQMARAKLEQEGAMAQLGMVEKGMGFGQTATGAYGSLSDLSLVRDAQGVPTTKTQAVLPVPPGSGLGTVAGNPGAMPGAPAGPVGAPMPLGVPGAPAPGPQAGAGGPLPGPATGATLPAPAPAGAPPAGLQPTPGSPGTNPAPAPGLINLQDIPAAAKAMATIQHARANPGMYAGPGGIARYQEAQKVLKEIIDSGQGVDAQGRVGIIAGGAKDPAQLERAKFAETTGDRRAAAPYTVREGVATDGSKTWITDKDVLDARNAPPGDPNAGGLKSQEAPDVTERRSINAKNEDDMRTQFKGRQVVRQRINELFDLGQKLQTGKWADVKGDIVAGMRSLGIPFKSTDTANPEAVQQWIKNSTANVFDQVKALGGRILVSEIEGLAKANAQPNLEPAANLAILQQMAGLIDYEDKYYNDYTDWRKTNRGAPYLDEFDKSWYANKENKPQVFIDRVKSKTGAKGIEIPPPEKRVVGQVYTNPNGVSAQWTAEGWVPVPQRTGDR